MNKKRTVASLEQFLFFVLTQEKARLSNTFNIAVFLRVFVFPGPNLYLPTLALNLYLLALARIGNNKSQSLDVMLLFLYLLSNPYVTVIVDRNEIKSNLSKKQINKYNWQL